MKRIFSILLVATLLFTVLVPAAFADAAIDVALGEEIVIELEDYYAEAETANASASGGAYVIASDKGAFAETGDPSTNIRTTPLVRTITLDVETAAEYTIQWVANKWCNSDTSPMTLAVNGTDIFKVVSTGNDFSITGTPVVTRDGKGQDATGVISTTCVDAYPGVAVPNANYDLQLYTSNVDLVAGTNTIEIYVVGGVQWGMYNFAMDCVKISSEVEEVSPSAATRLELDEYYSEFDTGVTVSNANASGSSLVRVQDKYKFSGPSDPPFADGKTVPLVRNITLDVDMAGEYTIEWVASAYNNIDSSPMTLAVNGTDVFDVIAQFNTTIKDGRGNASTMEDTSPSTDAGYTVPVLNGASTLQYAMKKYSATVNLNEGVNTLTLYVLAGLQWGTYNFVMDYVEFAPNYEFAATLKLDGLSSETPNEVTATARIVNLKEDLSDINAVMVVTMLDANGAIVGWTSVPVQCLNGGDVSVPITIDKNVSDDIAGTDMTTPLTVYQTYLGGSIPEIVSAKAFLRDCGSETSPTIFNATMSQLAPKCEVPAE